MNSREAREGTQEGTNDERAHESATISNQPEIPRSLLTYRGTPQECHDALDARLEVIDKIARTIRTYLAISVYLRGRRETARSDRALKRQLHMVSWFSTGGAPFNGIFGDFPSRHIVCVVHLVNPQLHTTHLIDEYLARSAHAPHAWHMAHGSWSVSVSKMS